MADIFVSCVDNDVKRVRTLVGALRHQGWTVWWFADLVPGERHDRIIERELNAAKCIVVVWSPSSLPSDNVRSEAVVGRQRGCLVPVTLENAKWPSTFAGWQAVDLSKWSREGDDLSFNDLCAGIERFAPGVTCYTVPLAHGATVLCSIIEQKRHVEEAKGPVETMEDLFGTPERPTPLRKVLKDLLAAAPGGQKKIVLQCPLRSNHPALPGYSAALNGGALLIKGQEGLKRSRPEFVFVGIAAGEA